MECQYGTWERAWRLVQLVAADIGSAAAHCITITWHGCSGGGKASTMMGYLSPHHFTRLPLSPAQVFLDPKDRCPTPVPRSFLSPLLIASSLSPGSGLPRPQGP